jgi:hypothetical protein
MEALAIAVLEALATQVGIPLILKWIAAKSPQEQTQSILDAEYSATRTATDAEARLILTEK